MPGKNGKNLRYSGGTRTPLENKILGEYWCRVKNFKPKQPSPSKSQVPALQQKPLQLPEQANTVANFFFYAVSIAFFFVCIQLVTGLLYPSSFAQGQLTHCPKNPASHPVFCGTSGFQQKPWKSAGWCCCGRSPASQHPHLTPNAAGSRERPGSSLWVFTFLAPPAPLLPLPRFCSWSLVAFTIPEQLGGIQLHFCIA